MNFKKLNGKNVFVTGADGFIGSHLVEILVNAGAKVRALVYYNSWNEIGWLKELESSIIQNIEIVYGDVRDSSFIQKQVKGMDYVFHLSSLIAIPYSYDAPNAYVETNINGAMNILNSVRDSDSLVRLIHVSTSEVYGTAQYTPIDESHPLVGQSPYSASKISADKMVESYFCSFNIPLVTARPFNTFGPRQTARAVIPTIASQLISNSGSIKLGALSPTRDFNYVTDTANGMIALSLAKNIEGKVINIGSGIEYSIEETFEMLCQIAGKKVEIITDEMRIRPEKSEVNRLLADNKLIKKYTDWQPENSFEQGLVKTYQWIEKNIHLFNVGSYAK